MGSLEVPRTLRARKNLVLGMTERQKDILIGCVLGDAYIAPKGKIRIEQSTKQKDYLLWKYQELHSLAYPSLPREIVRQIDDRKYSSVFFGTRQYFRPWRSIFYDGRKKIFPPHILITPLSLAVWYMDDGCWTGKKCVVAIEGFDDESITRIQQLFQFHFGIETIVGKNRKLVVRKRSHNTFYRLISPHIVSSMKYKIPNPVTTSPA